MDERILPTTCPSCGGSLTVRRLACGRCDTAVEGAFSLRPLARLSADDQTFVLTFVKASGSLKDLAKAYGVSYPTVRNRLDGLIATIKEMEATGSETREA
jgi:hypothetical protein